MISVENADGGAGRRETQGDGAANAAAAAGDYGSLAFESECSFA